MNTPFFSRIYILLSTFICSNLCFGQVIFPSFQFENITTQSGLSNNIVTCLYQDNEGFLWIGTTYGLNKYDGSFFQKFYNEEGNKNSLSGNSIVDIIEDISGIFWIATKDGGLTKYDPSQLKENQFTQIKNNPKDSFSLPSNRMTALLELNKDYLIIGSENMMLGFLNKKTLEITYPESNTLPYNNHFLNPLYAIKKHESNNWLQDIKADANSIYITNVTSGVVYRFDKNNYSLKTDSIQRSFGSISFFDVDSLAIWYGSWSKGLFLQEKNITGKIKNIYTQKKIIAIDDEVTHIISWDRNILLAATKNSGVFIMDKMSYDFKNIKHQRDDKNSIASNRVICMLKDKNNILWLGTSEGLSKYNPVLWQFSAQEISKDYSKEITHYSIFENFKNNYSVCTNYGIYKTDSTTNSYKLVEIYYQKEKIEPTQIYPMPNGKFLLNSENASYWYYPDKEKIDLFKIDKYYSSATQSYYKSNPTLRGSYQVRFSKYDTIDNHPILIFGTLGWGLGIYDEFEKCFYDLYSDKNAKSISNNLVRLLFKDVDGNFWVGTSEGLCKWHKSIPIENNFDKYFHIENDSNSISGNSITGIYQDKNKHLWITTNKGLNEFDGNIFHHYKTANAESEFMYQIAIDSRKNLWIAVQNGFELFNLQTKSFQHITLPNSEWMLRYPAQILKRTNGEWMYGAGNNLISFNPENFYFESQFPKLYLTDFLVFDKSIFQTGVFQDLNFKHSNNFFTITFSALQLSQPTTLKYQYQLKGLNNDWINLDHQGKIVFTSLPPGAYTLLVKVTNAQGFWSSENTLVKFSILAPYWQQWWFFIICFLSIILLIFFIVQYREKEVLKLQMMRNKIANDLHDDVGSALSTINLYSEVAKMKSASENIDLKSILDKISITSIEMQENMNHIVWNLQPRNDNFDQMTLRLKSFAIENFQTKNIQVEFSVDERLNQIKLSPEQRKELFLIYKEVIHNIIKHAECCLVKIYFAKEKGNVLLTVKDDGKGFDINTLKIGNGLYSIKERSKLLTGKIIIDSKINLGTTIYLEFPLK